MYFKVDGCRYFPKTDDEALFDVAFILYRSAQPETVKKGCNFDQHYEEVIDIYKMIKFKN